jgi:hypothetical protein
MTLYLLDKNIVEDIKDSLKGARTFGAAVARAVDRKGATVSPLLSILEGSEGRAQSGPELHDQLMADTQAVGLFYRLAKTDAAYLRSASTSMATSLGPHMRQKTAELVPLALLLQALVVQPRTWLDARDVLPKIDALAVGHEVSLSHPLVICAIACLYGSSAARGVLKPAVSPTEPGAYNAVADIRLMIDTAHIRRLWNEKGGRESVRLLSRDKDLNIFDKLVQLTMKSSLLSSEVGPEIVTFSVTLSNLLLPKLKPVPKEMLRVLDYLRSSRDGDSSILI